MEINPLSSPISLKTTAKDTQSISYFKSPIKNIVPYSDISLEKVYNVVKSDTLKQVTEDVRNGSKLKGDALPYITPSGTFKTRKDADLLNYSGIICIDLDNLQDRFISEDIKTLGNDTFLNFCLMFISPSNNGLKMFVNIIDGTKENHLQHFNAIEKYLKDTYQLTADPSCKDISRACFLCHDPEAYYSNGFIESCTLLSILPQQDETPAPPQQDENHQQPVSPALIPEIHQHPSELLNRMPMVHDRAVSALVKIGWQQSKDGWTRPGKEPKNGISAKFNIDPKDGLYKFTCFSSNGQPFADKGYTDIGVICLLEYNDNWQDCIRELSAEYLTPVQMPKRAIKTEVPANIGSLPIDGMPPFIQDFIKTCSTVYNSPLDYWAASAIMATALGIGDKYQLDGKYKNVPILWTNLIGDVSTGKTEAMNFTFLPFDNLDKASHQKFLKEYQNFNEIEGMTASDRKKGGIDRVQEPNIFQYIVKDSTPEALTKIHSTNNRGLMINRDELKGWLDDFNRYSKSGEQSNLLSTFNRVPMVTNRKGGGVNSVLRIDKPCILIFGGMQPDLIPSLAADNRGENGFLARFCNVWPDNTEKPLYTKNRVPANLVQYWSDYIGSLVQIPEQINITLSDDAENLYSDWCNKKNKVLTDSEPTGFLKGVYGKLDIISLRLAVVLYGMNRHTLGEDSQYISGDEMAAALSITEYFRLTALKVSRKLFGDQQGLPTKRDVVRFHIAAGKTDKQIMEVIGDTQQNINKIRQSCKL
jgi:hypothetical protein